ncbi:acetylxylan esterase [Paenibacillus thalictri]|uniref:Alpha/beta fold hydrolase n=1 Tax=Paenibacillus thalictri TaxID=2527873 RepID=A0A4Q9DSV4_9BACL|nr:alpha/beta fold hydrolase [Paenibacillus thalictri]TBL79959.1 alpha/beta fold hydrolase [Paenibacillus thalictri]
MNAIDKKIKEWTEYRPDLTAQPDLGVFWEEKLQHFKQKPLNVVRERVETPFPLMETYRLTYEGFDDTPIHGWYLLPPGKREQVPCVVLFHGYTGGKGFPEKYAQWLLAGIAVLAVDVRGQSGETGNRLAQSHGMSKGWMTQNILDKHSCYYMAITVDALKAVEAAAAQPEVDQAKIAVVGASQGGGLSLIASALGGTHSLAVADIPNMCHMDLGIFNSVSSLKEAADYVRQFPEHLEPVLETLSYFDMLNLADRIRIPVLVSVGLKDPVCMPETVFAAYNRIESEKLLYTYPFHGHETGGRQNRRMFEFIRGHWAL